MGCGFRISKIYHHYEKWEEHKFGMWLTPSKEEAERLLPMVVKFTGNHIKYGNAMLEVIKSWKYSCEDKLTDTNLNRKAWLGHAACCHKFGWPESLVRLAWGKLNNQQQLLANGQAERAINIYLHYLDQIRQKNQLTIFDEDKNREIHKRLGIKML
jgi:hypothetical protein